MLNVPASSGRRHHYYRDVSGPADDESQVNKSELLFASCKPERAQHT